MIMLLLVKLISEKNNKLKNSKRKIYAVKQIAANLMVYKPIVKLQLI